MCSLMSERRGKWTGLDKYVWLHLPWAKRACKERYGMCENPPSLLHTSAPTAAHQPLQGPDNFPYLIGHRAEHGLGQCSHMMLPSGSSKCTVTHPLERPAGSVLWNWFAGAPAPGTKTTHVVPWPPLVALLDNCKLSGMLTAWNPKQGLAAFCKSGLRPKQLWVFLQNSLTPANFGHWKSVVTPGENTPWDNTWFSNSVAVLLKQSCGTAHSKFPYWTGEQMLHKLSSLVGWAAPFHQSQQTPWNTPRTWNHPGDSSSKSEWKQICAMVHQGTCAVCTAWSTGMTTNFRFSESSLQWLLGAEHLLPKRRNRRLQ